MAATRGVVSTSSGPRAMVRMSQTAAVAPVRKESERREQRGPAMRVLGEVPIAESTQQHPTKDDRDARRTPC